MAPKAMRRKFRKGGKKAHGRAQASEPKTGSGNRQATGKREGIKYSPLLLDTFRPKRELLEFIEMQEKELEEKEQ